MLYDDDNFTNDDDDDYDDDHCGDDNDGIDDCIRFSDIYVVSFITNVCIDVYLCIFIELEQITMQNLTKHEKESLERIHNEGDKAMMTLQRMEMKLKNDYHSYHVLQQKQQLYQRNYQVRLEELSQLTKELCQEQKLLLIEKKKVRMQRYQLDLLLQHMNDIEPMLLVNDGSNRNRMIVNDGSSNRNRMMNYQSVSTDDIYNQQGSINDMMRSTYPLSSHLPSSSSSYPPTSLSSSSSSYASSQPTTMNPAATAGVHITYNHDDYANEVKNSLNDDNGDQHDFVKAIKGQLIESKSFRHVPHMTILSFRLFLI